MNINPGSRVSVRGYSMCKLWQLAGYCSKCTQPGVWTWRREMVVLYWEQSRFVGFFFFSSFFSFVWLNRVFFLVTCCFFFHTFFLFFSLSLSSFRNDKWFSKYNWPLLLGQSLLIHKEDDSICGTISFRLYSCTCVSCKAKSRSQSPQV